MAQYQQVDKPRAYVAPRDVKPLVVNGKQITPAVLAKVLPAIGVGLDSADVKSMISGLGFDSLQGLTTTASITTPVQFLQAWMPNFIKVVTAARKADQLAGVMTIGSWESEEIVQGIMEYTGTATPYTDHGNVPFASWNTNFERRTIVRFEDGLRVGLLEEGRAAAMRVSAAESKRNASALALEIERNKVGFNGWNSGNGRTYGILNDPNLPNYGTVATGAASSTTWALKTFLEIVADIVAAIKALRAQSKDVIDPETTPLTLAIAMSAFDYLATMNTQGTQSVKDWLAKTYPNIRPVSVPEFDSANGGANVFYLYAERVEDGSDDDGVVMVQLVPAKFQVLGVEKRTKEYVEDYSNATAGVLVKRPYGVVRRTGI